GHAYVALRDDSGLHFEAVAFEPTHAFRDAVRGLRPGDRVEAVGAWREGVVNLEKLHVLELSTWGTWRNPACPACGRSMPRVGKGQGHRCRGCGGRAPEGAATVVPEPRALAPGWHEAPVMARRHLHRPLAW
ncbi:MAG TPA: tRNA(Ile2) 2-agmatinylcytidine synthetase, partial [Candidatus Thermoplasmatota archaeon]|nr:tRNA(Ile2) 2-agmatinylcytidine synthetase [Candidatus Thermoplasmatota archaeon]